MMPEAPELHGWLLGQDDPIGGPAEFAQWLVAVLNSGQPIAIDTETTGLEWWTPHFTRLWQIGTARAGWAVPVEWYGRVVHWAMEQIRRADVPVIMQNAKFDMHALEHQGFPVPEWRNVHDTKILHHLISGGAGSQSLKPIAARLLGPWAKAGQRELDALKSRTNTDWATVPVDAPEYWAYGVMDTIITRMVWDKLSPALSDLALAAAYEREMAYQAIMYRAECRGLNVNVDYATRLRSEWLAEASVLRSQLEAAGIENPNSGDMIAAALSALGWEPDAFTPTGRPALDRAVKDALAAVGGPIGEVAEALIRYQRLTKWTSTYLDPFIASGGVIHASINTLAARHGRSSITGVPLQTLPSHEHTIRAAVVPANEDRRLVSIDYSGQELRIFASYANEASMIYEFTEGAKDLHALVARLVYGEGFAPEHRAIAKVVNFARIYGAGARAMALQAGVAEDEMKRFLDTYNARFPRANNFMQAVQRTVVDRETDTDLGYVITRGGRRAAVDKGKPYTGVNYLISGSGADVLKEATCRLDAAGLADFIVIPVHDEILFDFPAKDAEVLSKEAAALMEDREWFSVPLEVEASPPVERWSDAK